MKGKVAMKTMKDGKKVIQEKERERKRQRDEGRKEGREEERDRYKDINGIKRYNK